MEKVLDVIITFVKAIKRTQNEDSCYFNDGENILWNAKYLLNQILRSYNVPEERKFITVKAKEKWSEITLDQVEIKDYYYTKNVPVKTKEKISLTLYTGARRKGETLNPYPWDNVMYRQVFHDEHVISISAIIDEMCQLDFEDLTHEKIQKVLEKIWVCRMLKEESHELDKKFKMVRKNTILETIDEIFIKECNIEIDNWEEKKKNLLEKN